MQLSDLKAPLSLLGGGTSAYQMIGMLRRSLGQASGFTHMAPVEGEKYSARVIATFPFKDSVPLPHEMTPEEMAREIALLTREARYHPASEIHAEKGWSIFMTTVNNKPAVYIRASWLAEV